MTRWARRTDGNKKKPHSASSWSELRKTPDGSQKRLQQASGNSKYPKKYDAKLHGTLRRVDRSGLAPGWKPGDGTLHPDRDSSLHVVWKRPEDHDEKKETNLVYELEKLKSSVKLSAEDEKEISIAIKKDQRREKRRVKRMNIRDSSMVCFHCRQAGHDVASCPETEGSTDTGTGICFRCGSGEHTLRNCKIKGLQGDLPFAKCFVCGKQGHLASGCPDNTRGVYPNGGCCGMCGSIEHFKRNCPQRKKQDGVEDIVLPTLDQGSADAEISETTFQPAVKKKQAKIVKF